MIERCNNAVPSTVAFIAIIFVQCSQQTDGFQLHHPYPSLHQRGALPHRFQAKHHVRLTYSANFNAKDIDSDDDDEIDDAVIDVDALGDWRTFRRNLVAASASTTAATTATTFSQLEEFQEEQVSPTFVPTSVSKDNEDLLWSQSEDLAREYTTGVWAHTTATPEVGGLLVRLPLEVEIFRNRKHSLIGRKLQRQLTADQLANRSSSRVNQTKFDFDRSWYYKAQKMIEAEMKHVASKAQNGQIDASALSDTSNDMLQLYLDQQETWQEVCLVLQRDESTGSATTLVLNRPMALKVTDNLARLILFGAFSSSSMDISAGSKTHLLIKFMLAFGQECAVYIGGPDAQDQPAVMIHGHADLPGAVELASGTNLFRGGSLDAAMDGVLWGKYRPMDFRFFVGRHDYKEHLLDVAVVLGKYQPVACARSLALKQCISLPKPLWHEVLEICGGDLREISALELLKRDDLQFEIIEEEDEDRDDYEIPDELGELEKFDDDDEDFDE